MIVWWPAHAVREPAVRARTELALTFTSEDQHFISQVSATGSGIRARAAFRRRFGSRHALIPCQHVENSDQFSFRAEIDLDPAPLPLPNDANLGAQEQLQTVFGSARMNVNRR